MAIFLMKRMMIPRSLFGRRQQSQRLVLPCNSGVLQVSRHNMVEFLIGGRFPWTCDNRFYSSGDLKLNNQAKISVAIVGAGPAGLSAALHLAPLVSKGILQGPIHIYESTGPKDMELHYTTRGTGTIGREVGVGIWSTALWPFVKEQRKSHEILLNAINKVGTYVDRVGYRTPDGSWLAKSKLPIKPILANTSTNQTTEPGLVFLQEKELLKALHQAIQYEVNVEKSIILNPSKAVEQIVCDDMPARNHNGRRRGGGRLVFHNGCQSDEKFGLILSAGGTHSILRKRYSRHMDHTYKLKFGINLSPNRADTTSKGGCKRVAPVATANSLMRDKTESLPLTEDMEERGYVVFRGNSRLPLADYGGIAFQTWGTKHNLRFATVPCTMYDSEKPQEGQVWFFTTNDATLLDKILKQENGDQTDNEGWKKHLEQYIRQQNWHDPVAKLIESTPADRMWMETAVAHRYSAAALGSGFEHNYDNDLESDEPMFFHSQSDEPLMVYVGDADMTVDPVLAQGITIAMEDAANISNCLQDAHRNLFSATGAEHGFKVLQYETLRGLLKERHIQKGDRLLCLLRATELVHTLAQPSSWTGVITTLILRPLMKYGAPDFVKRSAFDWMLKYSLGMFHRKFE